MGGRERGIIFQAERHSVSGFDNLIWPLLIISFGPTPSLMITTSRIALYKLSLSVALLLLSLQGSPEAVRFRPGLDDMRPVR
jgi:hypothetical protein